MAEGAKLALEKSGCDIIDINMGCPAPKIVNNGDGSALMKDPELASKVIAAVVNAVDVPVTVKFRKGWDEKRDVYKRQGAAGAVRAGYFPCAGLQCAARRHGARGLPHRQQLSAAQTAVEKMCIRDRAGYGRHLEIRHHPCAVRHARADVRRGGRHLCGESLNRLCLLYTSRCV